MTDDARKVPTWANQAKLGQSADMGQSHESATTVGQGEGVPDHLAAAGASTRSRTDTNGNLEPDFKQRWKSYAQSTKMRWLAVLALLIVLALAFAAFRAGANTADRRENEGDARAHHRLVGDFDGSVRAASDAPGGMSATGDLGG